MTNWRVRCEYCKWFYDAPDEATARNLELTHQRDHERNSIDADIKVYPLPALEEKVQMNGWQLAGVVVLALAVGAVLFLLGVRT